MRCYMTTLLIVRHGFSEANKEDLFAGFYDAPLDERGILQAQITAQYIKEHYKISHVYASDLKRAYRTGETVAACCGVGITANQELREIFGGEWEGKKFSTLAELYPDDFPMWMTEPAKAYCTGGESVCELAERAMKAIEEIALRHPDETVAVATHATVLRTIMTMVQYGELAQISHVPWVSNASVTEISYEDGKFHLLRAGIDDYLEGIKTSFDKKE